MLMRLVAPFSRKKLRITAPEQVVQNNTEQKKWARFLSRTKQEIKRITLMMIGVSLAALGYSLFQVPYNIAAGGISGLGIIINYFTGWPIGLLYFLFNIPLIALGFFYLGRWSFVLYTLIASTVFSIMTEWFLIYVPGQVAAYPLTDDVLLSAVYAGIIGGIGGGLIYRSGGTMGGTGIIGRIIQQKTGIPLSQVYLYTDGGIVIAAGIIFGWEIALYALLTLFLNGIASDYTMEGPSNVRTATIITTNPEAISAALMHDLGRGVSQWQVQGCYTGEMRTMLMCTIYRNQMEPLKQLISQIDTDAFVTIGVSHQALGFGFSRSK